jgi:hypothetical protein
VLALLSIVRLKTANADVINMNQTFTTDTVFNPFPPPPPPGDVIYTFKISGTIEMSSPTSLARVIFVTDKGEFMVIESFPLISADSVFEFSDYCDETCYLDGVTPVEIRLEITDATIYIHHFFFDTEEVEDATSQQYLEKKKADHTKVDQINFNITQLGMDWEAGNTSLTDLFYKDKKNLFGEKYNLLGYDYYTGGVYQEIGCVYPPVTNFSLVNHWDWRERHGANSQGSPYFDNDSVNFTGWLTVPKNQDSCSSCGIFGTVGVLESIINLYYNQHLDLDLSEQHLLACAPEASCSGTRIDYLMDFLEDEGVVDESCSPYRAVDHEGDCEVDTIVCTDPDIVAKINSSVLFQGSLTSNWEDICEEMVLNGPIGLTINDGHHHVTLVGWLYNPENESLCIIFKDSYGPGIGDHGFVTQQVSGNYRDAASQHGPYFAEIPVQPSVQVYDRDGDGYCWWGIGPKPIGCDSCYEIRDCDDSNPFKHQYNEDYSCNCYDPFTSYDSIKITTDTTWQGSVRLDKPLIIEAGGKITKSCDELWRGIQIWGDSSLSQYPYSNQGYLSIINGGCIEYAKTAVFVGRKLSDTAYRYAYSGGIVTCEDALFLNNEVDVEFLPFRNDHPYPPGNEIENFSGFRTTKFKMYDPEFVLPKPIAHVILDEVNGVEFYGCEFITEEIPNYPIEENDRGIGILAYDAQVLVKGKCTSATIPCSGYDSCYFKNLRYGIKAYNSGKNKYFSVSESVLDSNVSGIYISGYHEPVIISSYFYIFLGTEIIPSLEEQFFGGIYLHGSTGYMIENNHFNGSWWTGYTPPPVRIAKIGIYIKDSGEQNNEIYNNLFTGIHAGIVAEGVNKGQNSGLCLKCNDFIACTNDILVTPGLFNERQKYVGINVNQGSNSTLSTALAGNTFSPEIQNETAFDYGENYKCYWSYFNEADYIDYYHHAENLNFVTYPSEDLIILMNPLV